jgi:hypothetical protein
MMMPCIAYFDIMSLIDLLLLYYIYIYYIYICMYVYICVCARALSFAMHVLGLDVVLNLLA